MTIVIVLVVLLTIISSVIAARPAQFRIERNASIPAPSSVVFPLLEDFHHWVAWSPWEKLDPSMKKTFSGSASGKGAQYAWLGNSKAGQGRMEILASHAPELVSIQVEIVKPFPSKNLTKFKLVPESDGTRVHWIMEGENNFMGKAFSLFVNMDTLLGKDLEAGLDNLKKAAQTNRPLPSPTGVATQSTGGLIAP